MRRGSERANARLHEWRRLSARALRGDGAGLPSNHGLGAVRVGQSGQEAEGKAWFQGALTQARSRRARRAPGSISTWGPALTGPPPGCCSWEVACQEGVPDQKEATIPPRGVLGTPHPKEEAP